MKPSVPHLAFHGCSPACHSDCTLMRDPGALSQKHPPRDNTQDNRVYCSLKSLSFGVICYWARNNKCFMLLVKTPLFWVIIHPYYSVYCTQRMVSLFSQMLWSPIPRTFLRVSPWLALQQPKKRISNPWSLRISIIDQQRKNKDIHL